VAPIERVNAAARALAAGDLHQRIRNPGEDETAALARSFDAMAEQLGGAINELNQQRARAESLLDQTRQLVANVAHELRTPMTIVRGHLEVLADEESESAGGQARLERLEPVLRETTRLELLIDDLFRASTADATAAPVVLAEVDVAAVARAAVEPLVPIAKREAGVTLVLSMSEAAIAVRADPDRLTQVIQILVRNALRHTPDGGMVLVEVEKDPLPDRLARIIVRDSGEGIPEEDLPHILARFYRGRNARGSATGAGLGLAIAHEFVDGMGGVLMAANDPVQGAVFTVTLPLAL
jgi:signal transduction histidine kinase